MTAADPAELRTWLDSLPPVGHDEAVAIVGATAARAAKCSGLPTSSALPDAQHRLVDEMPESMVALETPGRLWETLMAPGDRRRAGSHYTPVGTARHLARLALRHAGSPPRSVVDPAAGTGSFLLGVAEALEEAGLDRCDIVPRLSGFDLDPVALAVCETVLELWCGGKSRPEMTRADALIDDVDRTEDGFDLVVGNPPFLGQLSTDTARESERRELLAERFGEVAAGYVDESALFLVLAARLLAPAGVAVLLMPQSMLGSAHARPAREAVAEQARLAALWIETTPTFEAAVDVCAPVLVAGSAGTATTEAFMGESKVGVSLPEPAAKSWSPILAASRDVPTVALSGERTLGTCARATAGFRQHFYGLAGSVREAEPGDRHRLVTVGAIDPLRPLWGRRSIRFAGHRFERPVVDLDSIGDESVRGWMSDRLRPKVLVATQTRIVEAVVDQHGSWLPSVPVISIESDELDPWFIAALVTSPSICAHLAGLAAGTGLSAGAFRVRARDLLELPLPADAGAWAEGAELAQQAQSAAEDGEVDRYRAAMTSFAGVMDRAYGVDAAASQWWLDRVQFPD